MVISTNAPNAQRYDESYADVTSLQPVDEADLLRQRGRVAQGELGRIEVALPMYLGL